MRVAGAQFKTITHAAGLSSTGDPECSVANYTRRFEGLASRSIVGNRVMEAVPVTGIPPWDRGMGQGEMRIFRDRKSTRLNSSHGYISYAVFCLNKKTIRRV